MQLVPWANSCPENEAIMVIWRRRRGEGTRAAQRIAVAICALCIMVPIHRASSLPLRILAPPPVQQPPPQPPTRPPPLPAQPQASPLPLPLPAQPQASPLPLPLPLPAQAPDDNALRVYVVNGRDNPVPMVQVTLTLGPQRTIGRTDSAGVFRAAHLAQGDWQTTVRAVGYNQALVSLHVARGDNAYTIAVDATHAVLPDVNVVEARRVSIRIAGFERRRAHGEPSGVITREQLQKRNPAFLSQMFRILPGIRVVEQNGAKVVVAARGSVPAPGQIIELCPMRIAVDGLLRPPLTNLDETVPSDVHGIEVYYGPASLPLELATFRADKWCGLVAIWTRDR